MIIDDDNPHYRDKGKRQMSNNLLYSIKQAMPVLSEYTYIVHDHCSLHQNDLNSPSPKARFYRWSSKHTGIPETTTPTKSTQKQTPTNSSNASPTPSNTTTAVSIGKIVDSKGLEQPCMQRSPNNPHPRKLKKQVTASPNPKNSGPSPNVRQKESKTENPTPQYKFLAEDICYKTPKDSKDDQDPKKGKDSKD